MGEEEEGEPKQEAEERKMRRCWRQARKRKR